MQTFIILFQILSLFHNCMFLSRIEFLKNLNKAVNVYWELPHHTHFSVPPLLI